MALLCGLAVYVLWHSQLFRRESTQLRGLVAETKRIVGHSDGLNNPVLMETSCASVIEAIPEPLRTMMRERKFDVAQRDDQ